MLDLDKAAMGRRIKQIRLQRGYRQWELARMLGTTQSAVHKYEHGVVPEPRRLVELARIGATSIEWILTGTHWENGSREQPRLEPDVLRTAQMLTRIDSERRGSIDEAVRIVRGALRALADAGATDGPGPGPGPPVEVLRGLGEPTLRLLESAWRIQQGVLRGLIDDAADRLEDAGSENGGESPEPADG